MHKIISFPSNKNCFHSPYINTSSLIKKVYPNPQLSKHFRPLSTLATFIWQLGRLLCTNSPAYYYVLVLITYLPYLLIGIIIEPIAISLYTIIIAIYL